MEANQILEKGNSGSGKRPKADWNEKNNDIFMNVCIEQVRAGNRPHAHFNKVGWNNVIKNFNEQNGLSYDYKQMKNKWDIMKKEWQLWEKLKGKETGIGWDYISRTVTASDAWWQAKIEEYPEAAKFKDKRLKNLPEMEVLFKDIVATGIRKYAPSEDLEQGIRIEVADRIDAPLNEELDVEELDAQSQETGSSLQRSKRIRDGKNYKRGGVASRMCEQFDSVIESLNSDNAITVNTDEI
ncbi:hypothetical protein A2U01_0021025 [Trifolium medium]|uniref:Myb/SANT-like domain-containing protein n=1 Tax=Trifolium medium TaxID=97028 RepID=A0A392NJK6_9FABA|nr:hypothetical protein [Trifolium medium]